eukprot:TRINITY_DN93799_c0_g1_i1.p1 TRINITY_DN93799_c0_g1~~TRINITY_DN93799_c0_g1_i1.p1  ORF type:complete len:218 (+),score=38.00 TRINITY_DN93799_c0_g1_i1:286-939(+)
MNDKEMIQLLAPDVLKLMINNRQHAGILFRTYRATNLSSLALAVKNMGHAYNQATREQKGHYHGSPWWHSWQAMLDWVLEGTEEKLEIEAKNAKDRVKTYLQARQTPNTYYETVKQFKMWDEVGGVAYIILHNLSGDSAVLWNETLVPYFGEKVVLMPSTVAPPATAERKLRRYCQKKGLSHDSGLSQQLPTVETSGGDSLCLLTQLTRSLIFETMV